MSERCDDRSDSQGPVNNNRSGENIHVGEDSKSAVEI